MSSFLKIAAMVVLSSPLALAGCMAASDSTDVNEPAAQSQDASDALCTYAAPSEAEPCPAKTFNPPPCAAPVIPAPVYPAPHFGAPKHEAPVYKAPAYQGPTYQNPGQVPGMEAPTYNAPTYPGPTYKAPVYEAPIYDAPTFLAPIFERPTYASCRVMPANDLSPCVETPEGEDVGDQ